MASVTSSSSSSSSTAGFLSPKAICRIVGFTCLLGFTIDVLLLTLPPSIQNPQWRVSVLQQIGDRSIVLLFGMALLIGGLDSRRWLKQLSRVSLGIGILYFLLAPFVVSDTMKLQQQAVNDITAKATQVQSQISTAKADPTRLGPNVTLADLERASAEITTQVNEAQKSAVTTSVKAGVSVVGNLVVIGCGLIGLGRYAMRARR